MTTLLATLVVLGGQAKAPKIVVTLEGGKSFTIETDPKHSPQTVKGISALVNKKFYDGLRVHRVEDWVVQWGDPNSRNGVDSYGIGSGGTGKNLPFEDGGSNFMRGTVGIASTGARVGGDCQLFIVTKDSTFLKGSYASLGKVTKGMENVDKIQRGVKIVSMKVVK